jgi:hypothetical protein
MYCWLLSQRPNSDRKALNDQFRQLRNVKSGLWKEPRMQAMLDHQTLLPANLAALLEPRNWKDFRESASAVPAHITTGNTRAMWAVVDSANALPAVLVRLVDAGVLGFLKNAARAIRNVASHGTCSQIGAWSRRGRIRRLCAALESGDAEVVSTALEALECILRAAKERGQTSVSYREGAAVADQVLQAGAASKIRAQVLRHDDVSVRERSKRLLVAYFGTDGMLLSHPRCQFVFRMKADRTGSDAASHGRSS